MAINLNVNGNTAPLEAAVQAAVNRIRKTPIKITVDDKGATQPLGNMKRGADEFSKSMEAANARIIAFGASMAIINGVADAFKGMVKNLVEVEKAMADINVVMNLSVQNLDNFSGSLFKVAKETGAAFNIAAQAATEYARQGLTVEESLKRTRDALILTRLTGMDSAEAVKALTAAMNTYGSQINDTTQLVSKFAAVDVKFAVSAEDFADAIARTGQSAKSAGVHIDELIGLVTAAQQKTARGGKVIGNSFKTIFTRIGRTDTLNQLENLGIAVRDLEGNTLGAKRILTDLANTFDKLSAAQQAQIAQTVGGVFQINILKAVLSDAAKQNGILAGATQISANATDEAITKNDQLRQTMSAMATETGLAIKELSTQIGEIMLAPGMEKVLNVVKSAAEGLGNLLGDGESAGGKFANGLLKGIGNIITGPGMVVIVAVFGKLFFKAAQYAKQSLSSLIGVTSESQKQKAIQSSLVALFGRSAALNQEMLRTDISRTQKEATILALLQKQVAEASMLDRIAKSSAASLYRKGYNSGLAPKRVKAEGHIPNFSERSQAAKGGYAAGNIRSMNMPGQGSVIYNSAEKVKNFAGFKQPAIMPPSSSRAGKNYQQAFGEVHGFNPYAAGGYIPNFSKQKTSTAGNTSVLNAINFAHMLTPGGGAQTITSKPGKPIYGYPVGKLPSVRFNKFGISPEATPRARSKNKDLAKQLHDAVEKSAVRQGQILANSFLIGTGKTSSKEISQRIKDPASGGAGALQSVVGALFESAISAKIKQVTKKGSEQSGGVPGVASGIGGDFDLRNPSAAQKEDLQVLFGGNWARTGLADYKAQHSEGSNQSMAEKIIKEKLYRQQNLKMGKMDPALAFAGKSVIQLDRNQKRIMGPRMGARLNSYGHIPNFADPLSDAIGREKSAGVPVSQIRVGSHPALMGRSNPVGIGVTNTHDEPNGLRDVFGASGHIPNYAFGGGSSKVISNLLDKWKNVSGTVLSYEKKRELVLIKGTASSAKQSVEDMKQLGWSQKQTAEGMKQLRYEKMETHEAMVQAGFKGGNMGAIGNLNNKVGKSAFGKFMGGGGGMGAMMGMSMIGGMLPGASDVGSAGHAASSAMSYASTGMMMGSMAGPFAPIAMAIGGLGGALYGLSQASDEAAEALKEKTAEEQKAADSLSSALAMTGGVEAFGKVGSSMTWANEGVMTDSNSKKLLKSGLSRYGISEADLNQLGYGEMVSNNDVATRRAYRGGEMVPAATQINRLNRTGIYQDMQKGKGTVNPVVPKDFVDQDKYGGFYDKHTDMLTKQGKPLQREEAVMYKTAVEAYLVESERFGQIQRQMVEGLRDLPTGETISSADFEGGGGETKVYTANEYAERIEGMNSEQFVNYFQKTKEHRKEMEKRHLREANGMIIQLNIQKAIISAQNKIRTDLIDISDKYRSQIFDLDTQRKIMGDLMTERQKTELKYNKALLKNAEAEEKGKIQANIQFRQGVFSKLSENKPLEQEIKKQLVNDGDLVKGRKATTVDVTNALSKKSTEELVALFKRIKEINKDNPGIQDAMNRLIANELLKRQGLVDAAERTKELADGQANKEKEINSILDKRTQTVKDLAREIKIASNLTDQAMKGLAATEKTQDARRSFASAGVTGIEPQFLAGKQGRQISANRNMRNLALGLGKNMNSLDQEYRSYQLDQERAEKYAATGAASEAEFTDMLALIEAEAERTKKLDEYNQKRSALVSTFESERLSIEEILQLENARSEIIKERAVMQRDIDRSAKNLQFNLGKGAETRSRKAEIGAARRLGRFGPQSKLSKDQLGFDIREMNISASNTIAGLQDQKTIERNNFDGQLKMNRAQGAEYNKLSNTMGPLNKSDAARYEILHTAEVQRKKDLADLLNMKNKTLASLDEEIDKTKILKEQNQERLENQFKHDRSFSGGIGDGFTSIRNETDLIHHKLGEDLPIKLRDGLAKAMGAAINGAEDLGDVLRGVAMGFLQSIQQAMLQKAAGHVVDGIGGALGFSRGGQVPARVTNGEYVMSRGAVNKYGGSFMHGLNAGGKIPGYSSGGKPGSALAANFGGGEGYASGRRYQSQAMSGFFYSGQNMGLSEDAASTKGIIQERMRKAAEKKAKKKALMQTLLSTALSAGLAYGADNMFSGTGGAKLGMDRDTILRRPASSFDFSGVKSSPVGDFSQFGNYNYNSQLGQLYNGGSVHKYASGGYITGKSGIDQIPAMLSEGEYVVRASSARQIGKPMLDRINAGKFNDGGAVTPLMDNSETGISGGNTNNINITVNMGGGKGQSDKKENSGDGGTNPADASADQDQSAALAEKVKAQVVATIMDEQRPGGLLSD